MWDVKIQGQVIKNSKCIRQCDLLRNKFMFYFHCYKVIRKNDTLMLSIGFGRKSFPSLDS